MAKTERGLAIRFQLAGMGDERFGKLGRRVPTDALLRPLSVELVGKDLRFDTTHLHGGSVPVKLLDEFIALYKASDTDILMFARQYGVLSVKPFHEPGPYTEPLSDWRYCVAQARAMLSLAAALHTDTAGATEDWRNANPHTLSIWSKVFASHGQLSKERQRLNAERAALADLVNHWIVASDLRPTFRWHSGGFRFSNLHPTPEDGMMTLPGAIALQLALACSRARSIAVCAACTRPYTREWHSAKGRRNFCRECGIRAAWRESKRAIRAKAKLKNSRRR